MTPLEIVIDELVVRGLPPEAARRAADAFERRLAALADAGAVSARTESVRRLPPLTTSAPDVGADVADAVWASLGGRRRR